MKKTLIFLSVIILLCLLFGCDLTEESLNPPAWIIGTWADGSNTWIFTTDNVLFDNSFIQAEINFRESMNEEDITITDKSTSSAYIIVLKTEGHLIASEYRFTKISDTFLDYFYKGSSVILTKQ